MPFNVAFSKFSAISPQAPIFTSQGYLVHFVPYVRKEQRTKCPWLSKICRLKAGRDSEQSTVVIHRWQLLGTKNIFAESNFSVFPKRELYSEIWIRTNQRAKCLYIYANEPAISRNSSER